MNLSSPPLFPPPPPPLLINNNIIITIIIVVVIDDNDDDDLYGEILWSLHELHGVGSKLCGWEGGCPPPPPLPPAGSTPTSIRGYDIRYLSNREMCCKTATKCQVLLYPT